MAGNRPCTQTCCGKDDAHDLRELWRPHPSAAAEGEWMVGETDPAIDLSEFSAVEDLDDSGCFVANAADTALAGRRSEFLSERQRE